MVELPLVEMLDTANIVKKARVYRGLTQAEFGAEINRPQSLVSKYERGTVEPPGHIVIHCMNIISGGEQLESSSADITRLIEERLGASDYDNLRRALFHLIESMPGPRRRQQRTS